MAAPNTIREIDGYLTTMRTAMRLGISIETLRQFKNWKGWPDDACLRAGQNMLWKTEAVDRFLRNRRISNKGSRPRWLAIVQHPEA